MFETILDEEERGQVGIGTLIVFIAMVLVAAIAAGVLINTAGFLQSQAEATGEESTDLVSERIDVTSEVGIVGNASSGDLESVRLRVTGAAGADEIDLSETTIQVVGPEGQANLVFVDNSTTSGGDLTTNGATALAEGEFAVVDSSNSIVPDGNAVLSEDSEFTIILNPTTNPLGSGAVDTGNAFGESDESSLTIVSPASSTTSVELRAPDLFSENGEAVRL